MVFDEGMAMKKKSKLFILVAGVLALALALSACSTDEGSTDEQPVEENPFALIGAFHPSTGTSEPTEFYTDDQEGITNQLAETEALDEKKVLFVAAEVTPDEKKNMDVGAATQLTTGEFVSAAKLTIDGVNEYNDNYSLNERDYFDNLEDAGFHDGALSDEVLGGSDEKYKVIFMFFVSNNDFENGETAHLKWGDFEFDFSMADVQEVDTPSDMIAALEG